MTSSLDKRLGIRFLALPFIPLLFMSGCMTSQPGTTSDEGADLKHQVLELQKIQGKQTAQIEELSNRILVLKDQLEHGSHSNVQTAPRLASPVPAELTTTVVNPLAAKPLPSPKAPLFVSVAGSHSQKSGAEKIYEQAVLDSRKDQLVPLEHDVDLLLKSYRDSPFTNNALYLYAETLFERGQYPKSAEQFEKLYKLFPDGNKAVASLYELGLCYQKMNHPKEAQEAFQNVLAVYPGSREAIEAEKQILNGGGGGD